MLRDLLAVSGRVGLDYAGHIVAIELNAAAPLAGELAAALEHLLARDGIHVGVSACSPHLVSSMQKGTTRGAVVA